MLLPIMTATLVGCLLWTHSRDGARSPLTVALAMWATAVLLMSLPIFKYQVAYSIRADVFVALCLLATTGVYLTFRGKPRKAPTAYPDRQGDI